jgi:hypothetical protein
MTKEELITFFNTNGFNYKPEEDELYYKDYKLDRIQINDYFKNCHTPETLIKRVKELYQDVSRNPIYWTY